MTALVYQQSAYGYEWGRDLPVTQRDAKMWQSPFWLKMLSERHHRFINRDTKVVVWFHRSNIAPTPGSRYKEPYT